MTVHSGLTLNAVLQNSSVARFQRLFTFLIFLLYVQAFWDFSQPKVIPFFPQPPGSRLPYTRRTNDNPPDLIPFILDSVPLCSPSGFTRPRGFSLISVKSEHLPFLVAPPRSLFL